jgi:hypothetical protein
MSRNTLASKLRNKLFGGVTSAGNAGVTSSAPIRNSRGAGFSSTDPFKGMNDDRFSYGTLRYPEDLGTNEFGHYLLFHFYEVSQSQYLGSRTEVQERQTTDDIDPGFQKALGVKQSSNKVDHISKKEGLNYSGGVSNLDGDALNSLERNSKNKSMSGSMRTSGRLKKSSDTVALYLPNNLSNNVGASYQKSETGLSGVLGQDLIGAQNVDDLLSKVGSEGTFNTIRDALMDTVGLQVTGALVDLVGGGDLTGVVRKGTQRALNNAVEAIFTGVDLRTFSFEFRLIPRSKKELETINKIIKLFKFHSLPERVSEQKIGRHLIFPGEFDIQYMYKGKESQWYPFVSGCVLESVEVSYGPGGESQHIMTEDMETPAPIEYNLKLQFVETEIMTKEKVLEGF